VDSAFALFVGQPNRFLRDAPARRREDGFVALTFGRDRGVLR